ncbi:hypothetical protein WN943_024384 [Citrus x changshan-huyou]
MLMFVVIENHAFISPLHSLFFPISNKIQTPFAFLKV